MPAPLPDPSCERFDVTRRVQAPPAAVFALLTDPAGHVQIDSSGMLMSADGERVSAVGDTFVAHMDREALGDYDIGRYDVTVVITRYEHDRALEWTVTSGSLPGGLGHVYGYELEPTDDGTLVTSYYDWSKVDDRYRSTVFPVLPEGALKASLGILARTVQAGTARSE